MTPRRLALLPPLLLLLSPLLSVDARPLLVFLIDSFRYDYMDDLGSLPGFRQLVESGVKVDYMTPEFPTLSVPNFYSLMTGRHCDVHQMIGNYMWDEESQKEFLLGENADSALPLWWEGSEPLWVTLQKLGKRVSMYYWPGCRLSIFGVRPWYCKPYIVNQTLSNLIQATEDALNDLGSGKVDMAAVYYGEIDSVGHYFGGDSSPVKAAVLRLDGAMQALNTKLKEKKMEDKLNIMMFSDHGMTNLWPDRIIMLDKYMPDVERMMDRGPVVSVWPKDGKFESLRATLSRINHMNTYTKQEIPNRFHYKEGRFVSPLTLVAEPGWYITENMAELLLYLDDLSTNRQFGYHGYDNEHIDMRAFFLASGPDFKKNFCAAPIRLVDVYNLMCRTMGVEPLPNNGSWSRVEYFLQSACPVTEKKAAWNQGARLFGVKM